MHLTAGHSGRFGYVLERAFARVSVKHIVTPVCYEEVGEAIVVDVAGADALAPSGF